VNATKNDKAFTEVCTLRLCSHRHVYEYESRFSFVARRSFSRTSGTFTVTCTSR